MFYEDLYLTTVPFLATTKPALLAKTLPFGNTGAHQCSREAPSFHAAFAAWACCFANSLYAGPIQEYARSFSDGITTDRYQEDNPTMKRPYHYKHITDKLEQTFCRRNQYIKHISFKARFIIRQKISCSIHPDQSYISCFQAVHEV